MKSVDKAAVKIESADKDDAERITKMRRQKGRTV